MILYLPHKCDGKLMFLLCKKCSSRNNVQRLPCKHNDHERSWIDTYTSIDMQGALRLGYKVVEYIEVWHYREGGGNMFEEFILNIVRCKIECSGFPRWCTMHELKQQYVDGLFEKSSIRKNVESIRNDPAGRYLNEIMANSVWGKWTQNPSGQQEIKMCGSMHEYHDFLKTGCVKRVSLISDKLLEVELKLDRQIDGENRERRNCRSGLGGKNVIVGVFVMAASRDLMYFRYLSKLTFDQLLHTDRDSVIMYQDFNRADHVMLLTSDLLGNLKDKYEDVLREHPKWYVDEVIAFGPKMYHLILRDKISCEVVKWNKTMKGISLRGDPSGFSSDKLHLYKNPVIDFCCVLQYGNKFKFQTMDKVWHAMYDLECKWSKVTTNGNQQSPTTISVVITLDQHVFKRELAKVFTDSFILSKSIKKKIRVTQCK